MPDVGEDPTAVEWRSHPSRGATPDLELVNDVGEPYTRLVVVAAHPDDESLGAGGLIAMAHDAGLFVYVVLLTAGESDTARTLGRHAVATLRLSEVQGAVAHLAPDAPVVFLGAAHGQVARYESEVAASLAELIGEGSRTLVVAPFRHDGNDDHHAAGRAASRAARLSGAGLLEYPPARSSTSSWHEQALDTQAKCGAVPIPRDTKETAPQSMSLRGLVRPQDCPEA